MENTKEIIIICKENGKFSIRVYKNDQIDESYLPKDDLTVISNVISLMKGDEVEKMNLLVSEIKLDPNTDLERKKLELDIEYKETLVLIHKEKLKKIAESE